MTLATSVATLSYQAAMVELLELLRDPPGPSAFYQQALNAIGTNFTIPLGALELQVGGHIIHHTYRDKEQTSESWESVVFDLLTDALAEPRPIVRLFESDEVRLDACMIAVPLADDRGEPTGAMAMVAPCDNADDAKEILRGIHALALLASLCPLRPKSVSGPNGRPRQPSGQALRRLSRYTTLVELAFAITNNLRNKVNCDVVALGSVRRGRVKLLSVAGLEEVKTNSPAVEAVRAAMEECFDHKKYIIHQPGDEGQGHVIHKQWSERFGGHPVASVPLFADGECSAVVSLRRPSGATFSNEQLDEIRGLVQPYVEGMDLVDRASRGLGRHLAEGAREAIDEFISPRSWVRKAMAVMVLVAAGWFVFGTTTFEISAPCVVVPSLVQHVGAPFDGRITAAPFSVGDSFRKGDIICMLDTAALELERSRIHAEIEIAEIQGREALAGADAFGVELIRRKVANHKALLDLTELKIEQAVIRAPFDGFILEGDLRDRIGDGCVQGEPLFRLTKSHAWKLELLVQEADILHIRKGMKGEFASYARPEEKRSFEITRIHPAVEIQEGRSGVQVEGRPEGDPSWIRPGMEGVAKVEAGRRKVWWATMRRTLDSLRLHFWL